MNPAVTDEDRAKATYLRNIMPAFPRTYSHDGHNGMTIRDYFAGLALMGLVANGHGDEATVAVDVYRFADAMLAARESEK